VPKYVLDSNLYIQATRENAFNDELEAFFWSAAPYVYLHSVVAGELVAGAFQPDLERRTFEQFIEPHQDTGRIITPSHAAWLRAGQIIVKLVRAKRLGAKGIPRSFFNDCLIAASAREHGLTIITRNTADFDLIRTVEPVEAVPPWPEPRR
jgi:predicted nucleic acid-binding protein